MMYFERAPLWSEAARDRHDLDKLASTAALGGIGRLFDAPRRPSFAAVEAVVGDGSTSETVAIPRLAAPNIARAAIMYAEQSFESAVPDSATV